MHREKRGRDEREATKVVGRGGTPDRLGRTSRRHRDVGVAPPRGNQPDAATGLGEAVAGLGIEGLCQRNGEARFERVAFRYRITASQGRNRRDHRTGVKRSLLCIGLSCLFRRFFPPGATRRDDINLAEADFHVNISFSNAVA